MRTLSFLAVLTLIYGAASYASDPNVGMVPISVVPTATNYSEVIKVLEEKNHELAQRVRDLSVSNAKQKEALAESDKEKLKERGRLQAQHLKANKEAQKQVEQAGESKKQYERNKAELIKRGAEKDKQLDFLRGKIKSKDQQYDDLMKEVESLRRKTQEIETLKQQVRQLPSLMEELEVLRQQNLVLKDNIASLQTEAAMAIANAELAFLKENAAEVDSLKAQLQEARQVAPAVPMDASSAQDETIDSLNFLVAMLIRQKEEAEAELAEIKADPPNNYRGTLEFTDSQGQVATLPFRDAATALAYAYNKGALDGLLVEEK